MREKLRPNFSLEVYVYHIIHVLLHIVSEPVAHLPFLINRWDRSFFKLFIAQILLFVCRRLLYVAIFLSGCSAIGYTVESNGRYGTNAFVLLYYCPTWNNREANGSTSGEKLIGARRRRRPTERMMWKRRGEREIGVEKERGERRTGGREGSWEG